ncbi:hypothetical protein PR003_g20262 [Phytophthora rubi]|uniref:OTU domain-containing protein n=1 Tax=Phytophthora rubi TaxID=129364 RepID=A0A6A4DPP0_9STRA|nr:hypothetical protein PR003_g20262 [Phytophthora rubi]
MTVGSSSKPENATKSNSTADMIGKLSLPPEWGQSVNSASGAPKEDSKASHDASATSMGKDMVSTEETMQNILEQHAKVATGVTPTQCVDTKTAETAEEKEATRAKQVQPDTTNESTNTNFVEEEQPEVNQPEDSPAGCDGQRSSEYAEAVSAAKKNQTQQRAGREEGGRGRSPTVRSRRMDKTKKDLQADIEKSSQDASHRMSTRGRKGSLSLKRKAAAHWTADHTHDMLEELIGTAQIPRQHRTARSLSPKRRTTEATRRGEKMTMQKFMTDITGTDEIKQADCIAKEQEARPTIPKRQDQQVRGSEAERTDREANEERSNSDQEDQDCRVTHVSPPTDRGAPLDDWLGILGGKVVDVAANGQCGWIALYAALYNIEEGLVEVTKAVADSANLLKKRVINSMIANIVDEIKSHSHELQSELRASGCHAVVNGGFDEQMCALVNHLVTQRDKPVKAKVPQHYWVRPAHIKAMAQFARESLYVLDVQEDDQDRVQAYAYHDIRDAQDKDIEVDHIEYDEEKTAKEATQVLKAVRKAAKAAIQTAESVQGEYRHEFERGTGNRKSIGTEVRELIATCDEPSQQAEIRSLQVLPGQQIVKESTPSSREVASTAIEVRNSESTSLIVVTGDHDDETGGSSKALPEISTKIMEKVPVGMKKGMAEAPCQSAQAQGRVDSQ